MRRRKLSFAMHYVLVFSVLLFVANVVMGLVILNQSAAAMRTLINKDMLDVVKSAAASIDGDALSALTEEDVDGPVFRDIEDRLIAFRESVDIHFIYAAKQVDDETYVFTVDPDPVNPGAFGEEVVTTPALVAAAKGVPTVDENPAADRWGTLYSAFSPVFDSSGKVAGVVGIDFDARWFEEQLQRYTFSIVLVTVASLAVGAILIGLVTKRVRGRFKELETGLEELSGDVDHLMDEMASYSGLSLPKVASEGEGLGTSGGVEDELGELSEKIRVMQLEMGVYLNYLREQAYTDALTQVGNATAYCEATEELDRQIASGYASFWMMAFDVNSLKELNDVYGHECGDCYIRGAAYAIEVGFENVRTYRTGGDEFIAIAQGIDEAQVQEGFAKIEAAIADFNVTRTYPPMLAVSKGAACFVPGQDTSHKEVVARADKLMYEDKRAYYRTVGDRRDRDRAWPVKE